MGSEDKILGTEEAWDNRELGAAGEFVRKVEPNPQIQAEIDTALELQPISIRLQKSLIEDYKTLAQLIGTGYQPLMRQVLARFAEAEKKRLLNRVISEEAKRAREETAENCEEQIKKAAVG